MNIEYSIDITTALEAVSLIAVGDRVEVEIDKKLRVFPVISKDTYTITVQGETNRILCPIGWTTVYRELVQKKEGLNMSRMPLAAAESAPKRGRPRTANVKAPAEQPGASPNAAMAPAQPPPNHFLPPGSKGPPTHPAPVTEPQGTGRTDLNGDLDAGAAVQWIKDRLGIAFTQFSSEVEDLLILIAEREPEPVEAPPQRMTCADCLHSNLATDLCDRWNVKPPMNVICNAQVMCPQFQLDNPSAELDAEIPF